MKRQHAIEALARHRAGCISVATMQAAAPWKDAGQAAQDHLDASGCMGSASSLGLGLALGRPDRKVIVLDGDGSLLMQLGSLVTIASLGARNLYHFVFCNGTYESSGNQPIPGLGLTDFCALARAAGYSFAARYGDAEKLDRALPEILTELGPALLQLDIDVELDNPRWPGVPMAGQVKALQQRLASS